MFSIIRDHRRRITNVYQIAVCFAARRPRGHLHRRGTRKSTRGSRNISTPRTVEIRSPQNKLWGRPSVAALHIAANFSGSTKGGHGGPPLQLSNLLPGEFGYREVAAC